MVDGARCASGSATRGRRSIDPGPPPAGRPRAGDRRRRAARRRGMPRIDPKVMTIGGWPPSRNAASSAGRASGRRAVEPGPGDRRRGRQIGGHADDRRGAGHEVQQRRARAEERQPALRAAGAGRGARRAAGRSARGRGRASTTRGGSPARGSACRAAEPSRSEAGPGRRRRVAQGSPSSSTAACASAWMPWSRTRSWPRSRTRAAAGSAPRHRRGGSRAARRPGPSVRAWPPRRPPPSMRAGSACGPATSTRTPGRASAARCTGQVIAVTSWPRSTRAPARIANGRTSPVVPTVASAIRIRSRRCGAAPCAARSAAAMMRPTSSRRCTRPRWPRYGSSSSSMRASSARGSPARAQATMFGRW